MSKRNAAEKKWIRILSQFRRTTLSAKEFCRSQGVSYAQLHYWRNKLEHSKPVVEDCFVPVVLPRENVVTAPVIELTLPGGVTLRMEGVHNAQ